MILQPKKTIETDEAGYGIYVWQLPNGVNLKDGEGNHLMVGPVNKDNVTAVTNLAKAAAECGYPEGKAVYLEGFRPISQSEWEDQMERLMDGKVPDAADLYRQAMTNGQDG